MLNRNDNQIVPLTARSPENRDSGCSIMLKNAQKPQLQPLPTTEAPIELTTMPDGLNHNKSEFSATETIFDKFLRRTTQISKNNRDGKSLDNMTENIQNNEFSDESMENFNDTEVFNKTSKHDDRNGGGLYFKHDIGFENELENTTEYKMEVEELFESHKKNERIIDNDDNSVDGRYRRSNPSMPFRSYQTYVVQCHNAGTFKSTRERWWFIAIANCGNNKGLDIKYRFKMTNGASGDFWHEHYSADERRKISLLKYS